MRQSTVFVALSALTLVAAQSNNFTIDPSTVKLETRSAWCNGEFNTCNLLCGSDPLDNQCDPATLKFSCKCQNGTAPGLEYYQQTLPTFLCEESYGRCIEKTTGDSQAQSRCAKDIRAKCGTLDPTKAEVGGGSGGTSSSAAPSGSSAPTGNVASTSTQGAAAPTHAAYIGNGFAAVAAGVLAAALL
ncbi:hypothetical protein OQA88_1605 [Cercophora sp. LCS_1]